MNAAGGRGGWLLVLVDEVVAERAHRFVWIWHTLDSVTPKMSPISDSVSPSK
jgi:hypothetical protein